MKSLIKILTSMGVIALVQIAHAEGGCPEGMAPYAVQNQGGNVFNCTPIPGYNQQSQPQQPPPPPVRWADRYGSVVFGLDPTGSSVIGKSKNQINSSVAENIAMQDCISQGGHSCHIEGTYHNQCIAVIWGATSGNAASAPTLEKAIQMATNTCKKTNEQCQVYYTGCSMPVRIQ